MIRERTRIRGGPLLALAATAAAALMALGAPAALAAGPAYRGVQVHSLWNEQAPDMISELDAAHSLGANVVRVDVSWLAYEPLAPGQYAVPYKARVDRFMKALAARDMRAVAMIHQTPCWGPGGAETPGQCTNLLSPGFSANRPPRHASDYGRFVRYFTKRYRKRLAAIEVWNEPNSGAFFQAQDRPYEYTQLVKAAYPAVKAAAPEVKVLAGATSGSDADFLRGLYHYGIRGHYDAISVHPYTGDGSAAPDAPVPPEFEKVSFLQGLKLIRRTQLAAGDRTPLWATEFGWNTGAYRNMVLTPWMNGVEEPTQARHLARALALLNSSRLGFVEGATIYSLRDDNPTRTTLANFGLLRNDLTRKPSYAAVKRSFAAISRARQEASVRALRRRR